MAKICIICNESDEVIVKRKDEALLGHRFDDIVILPGVKLNKSYIAHLNLKLNNSGSFLIPYKYPKCEK